MSSRMQQLFKYLQCACFLFPPPVSRFFNSHIYAIVFCRLLNNLCVVKQLSSNGHEAATLSVMKQMFTLAVALLSFAAMTKAAPAKEQPAFFSISITDAITSISVSNGISVVLVEDATGDIIVTGEDKYVSRVDYFVSKGKLTIRSKKGSLKNKVTVTVPVNNLCTLIVNDNSVVTSKGWLESNLLTVIMKGFGNIKICNRGEVAFESDEDIDVLIQKWTPADSSVNK